MEKIQQLLNIHKDKLRKGFDLGIEEIGGKIIIKGIINSQIKALYSISDLLFNTPFLSWLKWEDLYDGDDWTKYDQYEVVKNINDSEYHKINLVLLSTDKERIKYVEQFVL